MIYPPEYIIICEAMHFLLSACLGLSVFFLTLTTLYSKGGNSIRSFLASFFVGLFSAGLLHLVLDYTGGV
jgi:hypothetical protein